MIGSNTNGNLNKFISIAKKKKKKIHKIFQNHFEKKLNFFFLKKQQQQKWKILISLLAKKRINK